MHAHRIAAVALVVLFGASSCGPNAKQRCADLKAATCPGGVPADNLDSDPQYCEPRYDGKCSGEWDDYVQCGIETPMCGDDIASPCWKNQFQAYAKCECEYEGAGSPWCW